jgi:hypothetical protein
MITRDKKKEEEAFYYSFENLSALSGNLPSTSRVYFLTAPFSHDGILRDCSTFGYQVEAIGRLFPKFQYTFQSGHLAIGCIGRVPSRQRSACVLLADQCFSFHCNWLLYDLGDPLSRALAAIQVGSNGIQSIYTGERIEEGLPDSWTWSPWSEGTQRNVYTDTEAKNREYCTSRSILHSSR